MDIDLPTAAETRESMILKPEPLSQADIRDLAIGIRQRAEAKQSDYSINVNVAKFDAYTALLDQKGYRWSEPHPVTLTLDPCRPKQDQRRLHIHWNNPDE